MGLFSRLFGKGNTKKTCPRCLGKGHVDWDDIKRLHQELKWRPGRCAYCKGTGKVNPEMESKISVDATYLTIELPEAEREKLINNESGAMERARLYDMQVNELIKQITYLHFARNMTVDQIAEFYLLSAPGSSRKNKTFKRDKEELVDYINSVIAQHKNNELN